MPTLKKLYSDHGSSQNRDGLWFPDHDSNMEWSEVQRLVLDTIGLLTGGAFDDSEPAQRPFKRLLDALASPDEVISVDKGIHQRVEDPHITLTIPGDEFNDEYEFHLHLSAEMIDRSYADGTKSRMFVWKAVKVSLFVATHAKGGKVYASHPPGTVPRTVGRARGYSITEGQIEVHVQRKNKELADKAEAERLEEERKKAEMAALLEKTEDKYPSLGGAVFNKAPPKPGWGKGPANKPGGLARGNRPGF